MQKIFEFKELEEADLVVDALYKGGRLKKNAGDDALNKLLGCDQNTKLSIPKP